MFSLFLYPKGIKIKYKQIFIKNKVVLSRELKIMAAPKTKTQTKTFMFSCDKCASEMVERMLAIRNSKAFIKILQCKVCRHWIRID